jgi:hypothetical protein
MMAKEPHEMTLHELSQEMYKREETLPHLTAKAELLRRTTEAQLKASAAEIQSAQAATKTATYTLWAAIAAAASAVISLVATLVTLWK